MKFNPNNQGHRGGAKPLFLGEPLGVVDTINVQYPQLEELYQKQLSQIWNEFEVDLKQDRQDMLNLPKDTVDLMVKTIMWQSVGDTVASRSIIETLGKYVTNTELEHLLQIWSFFEVIHARTYSHIIKQTFSVPNDMLEQIYNESEVLQRSEIIVQTFEDMAALPADAPEHVVIRQLIKTITALFALEAIAFMASFAVTFAITETGVFQGIGQNVTMICRDEVLHTRMDHAIVNIWKKDPVWVEYLVEMKPEIKAILDAVVRQELKWADYLFSEGRQVIGLTSSLLKEYTLYMARPLYTLLGVEFEFEVIDRQPISYMDKYVDSSKVQVAAQELQLANYNVGAIEDDTDALDLDDDEWDL